MAKASSKMSTIIIEPGKLAYVGERASSSSIEAKTQIYGQGKVARALLKL